MASDRCCCGLLHIKYGTIVVGMCSLLSTSINALLSCFDINRTFHHFYVEFCLILLDIISVLSLFYGVRFMRPNFLKPYVYINLGWCVALLLLFILSLTQMINDDEFSQKINASVADIFGVGKHVESFQTGTLFATLSLVGLLLSIAVNVWFLYVIFQCYQWMIVQSKKPFLISNHDIITSRYRSTQ